MSAKLLIYETAVPVSKTKHAGMSVEVGSDYGFSRNVNAVPLMAVEFPFAAAEYAIVFAGDEKALMPAAILGIREQENLYLKREGGWRARYIPAFVRRYPFVFSSPDEGKTFTLCIDEAFRGLNKEGRGERLFDDEGKPSTYVDNVLKFLKQYQIEFRRTQEFCRKLRELNLLEPMRAQMTLDSGERMALTGFMAVDRARLKTLTAERLAELAKSDELELIYGHLQSLRNFGAMREHVGAQGGDAEPGPAEEKERKAGKPAKRR
jgi:SapC